MAAPETGIRTRRIASAILALMLSLPTLAQQSAAKKSVASLCDLLDDEAQEALAIRGGQMSPQLKTASPKESGLDGEHTIASCVVTVPEQQMPRVLISGTQVSAAEVEKLKAQLLLEKQKAEAPNGLPENRASAVSGSSGCAAQVMVGASITVCQGHANGQYLTLTLLEPALADKPFYPIRVKQIFDRLLARAVACGSAPCANTP